MIKSMPSIVGGGRSQSSNYAKFRSLPLCMSDNFGKEIWIPHLTSNFLGPNGVGGRAVGAATDSLSEALSFPGCSSGALTPRQPRTQSSRSASFALRRMQRRGDSVRSPVPNFIRQTFGGKSGMFLYILRMMTLCWTIDMVHLFLTKSHEEFPISLSLTSN